MKNMTFIVLLMFLVNITFAQTQPPGIEFPQSINLGKIPENIPVKAVFNIKNTGNAPVVIENVLATCGCTVADYTKTPVTKAKPGTIDITYSAAQGKGLFTKTLYVKFSTLAEAQPITITGEVVPGKQVKPSAAKNKIV